MDQVYVLVVALAVLLIIYLAYRANRGGYKRHIRQPTSDDRAGATSRDASDDSGISVKEQEQIDGNLLYQKKASLIQKLLDTVKKTEGLRETTLAEIKNLEGQVISLEKALGPEKSGYSLRESDVRMTYIYSRIEWIIKSYPRLRNDKDLLEVQEDIRKVNGIIRNLKEG